MFKFLAISLAFTSVAFALDDLELEAALLEGALLEEQKPAEQITVNDPDEALLQQVEQARTAFENRLNTIPASAGRFIKSDEAFVQMSPGLYKTLDAFNGGHSAAMEKYREAVLNKDDAATIKLYASNVITERKMFLKRVTEQNRLLDKLEEQIRKLEKQAAAEDRAAE